MKIKTGWLLNCGLMLLFVVTMALLGGTKANAVVEYSDSNTIYSERTKEEVAKHYSAARYLGESYEDGNADTYYSETPSTVNPYKEGVLTDDTLKAMEGMTNFYRWLAGVEELDTKCVQTPSLQYQALDRNFQFDHYIDNESKPDDMSDELWQKGFECHHNILALGYTPQGAVTGWMNEGYSLRSKSWDTLGHRYALINPQHDDIQFGYCGRVAIGVYDFKMNAGYKDMFSAFPSAGYMPNALVTPSVCAWAADWDTEVLYAKDSGSVTITVTNENTNESYTCSENDNTASVSSGHCSFVQPSDYTGYRYTDTYAVKISGLIDKATGEDATLSYRVKFFDVADYADSYVKSVQPNDYSRLVIYQSLNDTESLKKIAAVLPDKVVAVAETGRKLELPVKGEWVLDEENQCYTNYADSSDLPKEIKDSKGLLKRITVSYTISDDYYDGFNTFRFSSESPKEHEDGWAMVHRTLVSSQHSRIFKLRELTGGYTGQLKFDSAVSQEYDTERSKEAYSYYKIDAFEISDSGEYISIYFSDSEYDNDAYVSTSIVKLDVSHVYNETVNPPTCTEQGYTTHICEVCGDTYTDSYTKALGHSYKDKVTPPTCTEQGYTTHICEVCGDTYTDSYTKALGHSYKDKVTPPTCTESGYTTHICEVCEDTYTDSYTESLGGHSYKDTITPPTCTKQGYTTHICEVCGDTYTDSYTESLGGHSYKDTVTPPTCTDDGYTTHTCEVCGETYIDSYIKALGHHYEKNTTPPTYTENGYTTYECSVCGDIYVSDFTEPLKITKAKQPMTVKAVTKNVKATKLKKMKVTVKKAISVKKNKGALTYKKISGSKYLTITKKGVITVKKGKYKKNTTLKIKVKVTAKGNANYMSGSKTVTVKIKVK